MSVPTKTTGPRWWEVAGAAHAIVQILYILIGLIVAVVVWMVRLEVAGAHTTDQFAVIEARHTERAAERSEMKKDVSTLHEDIVDLRVSITRLDTRIDEWKGKSK
jgi:peptidoglycan hydrolase CwlO-like protein